MADQTWQIPVSPAQRWALLQLSHEQGQKLQGQQGRVFRRFMRAFALVPIRDALRRHQRANDELINTDGLALFEITAENRDYALKLAEEAPRHPSQEMVLGDLWDALDATKGDYKAPEGIAAHNAAAEDWEPMAEEKSDLIDEIGERVAALDVAGLRHVLATLPAPAPPTNGAAASSSSTTTGAAPAA